MAIIVAILLFAALNLFLSAITVPMPINDHGTVRYNSFPYATAGLIFINVVVFLAFQAPDIIAFVTSERNSIEEFNAFMSYQETIDNYGFRGINLREGYSIGAFTSFTSMFMHVDFNHLISNMIFLWAFGRRLEDACGSARFVIFYLIAGLVANMGTAILASASDLSSIGASGAIFGVMGGYLLLFPFAWMGCIWIPAIVVRFALRVLVRLIGDKPEGNFRWTLQIPAILVVGLYIGFNVLPTFNTIQSGELSEGINYVAHMLGFLSAILIFLFVRKDLLTRYASGRAL
ncbi:MAG: rhomboid family intramembrane serine protease [Aggregatilineales bacterium]